MAPRKARGASNPRVGAPFCQLEIRDLGPQERELNVETWAEVSENHAMVNHLLDKGTLRGLTERTNKQN